jgi:predicted ATPase
VQWIIFRKATFKEDLILKLKSIEISNFKCHNHTTVKDCADFHTLIGRNSSGKSSIIECLKIIKRSFASKVDNIDEKVFGGIMEDDKEIEFRVRLELSEDDRRKYLEHYFHLPLEFVDRSSILKQVVLTFGLSVHGKATPNRASHHHLILKCMDIFDCSACLVQILMEDTTIDNLLVSRFSADNVEIQSKMGQQSINYNSEDMVHHFNINS